MSRSNDFQTATARVSGLGAARHGAEHWWAQRVSSVALIPLTVLALFPLARGIGAGHEAVLATYSHPFHAIVAILFIAVTFRHLHQGLQVVIEDYVHAKPVKTVGLLASAAFCAVCALTGAFAIARIAL